MKSKATLIIFSVVAMVIISACNSFDELAPASNYEEYNKVMEEYALAVISDDYYKMKQYLPDNQIQGELWLEEAKENDEPQDLEMLEKMDDRYSIRGFDYFFEEHGVLYYSVEYYNFKSGHTHQPLVFGVTKVDDNQFHVMNTFGIGEIRNSHIKNTKFTFTPMSIKEAMDENPENIFTVKEYPEV